MALSVRCGTCDAQLEALPKDSVSSQLLDPVGVLTSTAVVLMHKLEQDELIPRMSNTKRVMSSCTVAKNPSFEDSRKPSLQRRARRATRQRRAQRTYEQ